MGTIVTVVVSTTQPKTRSFSIPLLWTSCTVIWAARNMFAVVDFYCLCCVRLFIVDCLHMMAADHTKTQALWTLCSTWDWCFQLRTLQPLSHQSVLLLLLMTLLEQFLLLTLVLKGFDQTLSGFKWQSTAKLETHPSSNFALLNLHSIYQDLVNSSYWALESGPFTGRTVAPEPHPYMLF